MLRFHRIADLSDPGLDPFARLTDAQLRSPVFGGESLIVVESPKVIQTALLSGLEPVSLLCEERHIEGDAAPILSACSDLDVYVGPRPLLASLTGYTLTRGVLCASAVLPSRNPRKCSPMPVGWPCSTASATPPISVPSSARRRRSDSMP